jgi:hypothetical protein
VCFEQCVCVLRVVHPRVHGLCLHASTCSLIRAMAWGFTHCCPGAHALSMMCDMDRNLCRRCRRSVVVVASSSASHVCRLLLECRRRCRESWVGSADHRELPAGQSNAVAK